MRKLAVVLVFVAAMLLSGCGTACNTLWWTPMEGGQRPYGGLLNEVCGLKEASKQAVNDEKVCARHSAAQSLAFFMVDLPLTLVGDTITLPYTIVTAWAWQHSQERLKFEQRIYEQSKAHENSEKSSTPPAVPSEK